MVDSNISNPITDYIIFTGKRAEINLTSLLKYDSVYKCMRHKMMDDSFAYIVK